MGDRLAQEFWDRMWYWERYEQFPGEGTDDPHLVVGLASQVEQARGAGREPDPELMRRYDHCVGRVLARLTDLWPRRGEAVDLEEVKYWLRVGLDRSHRGHDAAVTPIIDANSLVIFLLFVRHAREYCGRHGLAELGRLWADIERAAQEVENQHAAGREPSRFDPPA